MQYQVIALNDQHLGPTSPAPLSPYLNDATQQCKQCVDTKKVFTRLTHKKKSKIEIYTNILAFYRLPIK